MTINISIKPVRRSGMLFIAIIVFVCSSFAFAEKNTMKHSHDKIGIHGMVIFSLDEQLFASHMPLANSIHAHQIIFSLSASPKAMHQIKLLLSSHDLVTLMPEKFDLNELMNGQLTEFNGMVFTEHFERGGKLAINDINFTVEKVLLNKLMPAKNNGIFWLIPASEASTLLVHQIASAPSFDQIISVKNSTLKAVFPHSEFPRQIDLSEDLIRGPNNELNEKSKQAFPLINNSMLIKAISEQAPIDILYTETRDFRK